MKTARYVTTGEIVTIEEERGNWTRVSHFGSSQFVPSVLLEPVERVESKTLREASSASPSPKKREASPRTPDEVSLFLREMETEDDLRGVCKDIGMEYPIRSSLGLTKMAIGNHLRKLIKNGEYELSWA